MGFIVTGGESDSPDEDAPKCAAWSETARPAPRDLSSDTGSESSDSDEDDDDGPEEADYRTLTPARGRLDSSALRDDGFRWMPPDEERRSLLENPPADYTSASLDRRRKTTSDRGDRDRKSRSSLSGKPPQHPAVRASPRPRRQRPDDVQSELQRRWNSYEHFRWPEGGWWPVCWCHGPPPPAPAPCYMHERAWPSHPSLPSTPARTPCKV